MNWFLLILKAIGSFFQWLSARDQQDLGRLRERERQQNVEDRFRRAIDAADPDRVPDDEAFK